ncbi:MAG TPA: glycosyltransferase family 2 protein [Puia sp.]|jgi:GT2 family glycosyltransferase
MKLSVIIVNYQVKYFLELCLHSVEKAVKGLEAEVIVVDNHSMDDSLVYLQSRFPRVQFLANPENTGFARANNRALELARGETILFLNPDTILPEDIATHCLAFLATTSGIGGLGVRMIDGGGEFLKESRRGFPTPWVGFCRLSGLSTLFPRSRRFAGYYLGHLPADGAHPAPVLSGACLWVSREVLGKTGFFDPQFFLYAEDIDLSYRIGQAGFTNYYTPAVTIVHFKGESTRKDLRYVQQFYRAMRQFRRKHFNRALPPLSEVVILAAIRLRAGLAAIAGFFRPRAGSRVDGPVYIGGDLAEAERVSRRLGDRRTLVDRAAAAREVLLCEGDGFSFRDCIGWLEKEGRMGPWRVLFHAGGSDSAVGSPDRKDRGEALEL